MFQHFRILSLGLALGTCLAGPAAAQDAPMLDEADHEEWQAIGRVNIAGLRLRRLCTGTLIAPDVVLTAAHCVFALSDDHPHAADEIHFVAGWFRGDHIGHSVARKVHLITDWKPGKFEGLDAVAEDIAVLELETPIEGVAPLAFGDPVAEETLRIIGYRWNRPHALSDYGECDARAQTPMVLVLSCPVTFGTSGAPVLQNGPNGWRIVGVTSAIHDGWTLAAALPR